MKMYKIILSVFDMTLMEAIAFLPYNDFSIKI